MTLTHAKLRKAALLVTALDRENAEALLRQLPSDQAARVRRAAASLGAVDPAEQEAVIAEFFRIGPLPAEPQPAAPRRTEFAPTLNDPQLPGIELDGSLAGRFSRSRPAPAQTRPTAPMFRCLDEADCSALVPLLEQEHPQTIAVVVSHLSHTRAAELLTALPAATQAEVLRRLTHLDEMDPESLHEIEHQLESWVAQQIRHRQVRSAGLHAVARILQAAPAGTRDVLVGNLRRRDALLADRLHDASPTQRSTPVAPPAAREAQRPAPQDVPREPRSLQFEDLARLDDTTLRAVLETAEPELIVLALAGVEERVLARFLRQLPQHEATALRRDLQQLGPTRLSDVEAAQRELAAVAQQLTASLRAPVRRGTLSMAA